MLWRWTKILVVAVLLLCAVILGTGYVLLTTERGSRFLVNVALPMAESALSQRIRLVGFQGTLARQIDFSSLTIADEKGDWLEVSEATLEWDMASLWDGKLTINRLEVARVGLLHVPSFPEAENKVSPARHTLMQLNPARLGDLVIKKLSLPLIHLSGEITGMEARDFAVSGTWHLDREEPSSFLTLHEKGQDAALLSVQTTGAITQNAIALKIDFHVAPPPEWNVSGLTFVPGEIRGTLMLGGAQKSPTLKTGMHMAAMAVPSDEEHPPVPLSTVLNAEIRDARLHATLYLDIAGKREGEVRADVPLAAFFTRADVPGGTVNGQLNLSAFQQILHDTPHQLAGMLDASVQLNSSRIPESLTGRITLKDANYANIAQGAVVQDVTMQLALEHGNLTVEHFHARDGEQGLLTLDGWVQITKEGFDIDLKLGAEAFHPVTRHTLQTQITGDIHVKGNQKKVLIEGDIIAGPIKFTLPKNVTSDIPTLQVSSAPKKTKWYKERQKRQEKGAVILLDVTLDVPGKVFIYGDGLELELEGKIAVAGPAAAPEVNGTMQTVRGKLELLNRKFTVEQGHVRIQGQDAFLQIISQTTVDEDTLIVMITGPATQPEISLSSVPPLPQDEIMARILFGRHLSAITPLQALQLANALRKLRDGFGSGGFDPLARTRDLLGVDSVSVESGKDGGVQVGAGKYVSEKVYVEVNKDSNAGGVGVRVEVEVTPQIFLESTTSSETSAVGVGVNWKKDY